MCLTMQARGFGDMSGLVASLCQQRGLDPNMVMAMMNNRGVGYGEGGWFMWIIILLIFGWGGFGGNGWGGRGNAQGFADLGNLVNNDAGRELYPRGGYDRDYDRDDYSERRRRDSRGRYM